MQHIVFDSFVYFKNEIYHGYHYTETPIYIRCVT